MKRLWHGWHISAVALVVISLQIAVSAQTPTDREQHMLFGSVREIKYEIATIETRDGQLVEGPRRLTGISRFDKNGDLKEVLSCSRGKVVLRSVYSRDDAG